MTLDNNRILPARLNATQVALRLGFSEHDIPVLVANGLLKPLGKPVQSATKYFATAIVEELATDVGWLNKATQTIYGYWKSKNDRKSSNQSQAATSFAE